MAKSALQSLSERVAFYWFAFFNFFLFLFLFLKNGAYTKAESRQDKAQYAIGASLPPPWKSFPAAN